MSVKADTWMPFYVNDYLGDTLHLTRDEHGAYLLLIMAAWNAGGRLPNRPRALAAIAKASLAEWEEIAESVLPYFTVDGDFLIHGRVSEEREKAQRLSDARRETGAKGGRPKKQTESEPKANGSQTETKTKPNGNLEGSQTETPEDHLPPSPSSVSNETAAVAAPSDELSDLRALPVEKGAWRLAVKVLVERGRLTDAKARTLIGKLTSEGLSRADLWSIAEDAWSNGTLDPTPYLIAAAERLARPSSPTLLPIPPDQILRVWCEDWLERPHQWRQHERGPPPGKPGCRIKSEILDEFGLGNVVTIGKRA